MKIANLIMAEKIVRDIIKSKVCKGEFKMNKIIDGEEAFKLLANLEKIDEIEKTDISKKNFLSEIQELYLTDSKINQITSNIKYLKNLKNLYIQLDYLISLPDSLGDLSNLHFLHIRGQKLSELPKSLGNLVNLIKLDIRNINSSSIPESLGNLSNLDSLYISGNNLSSLPESLGNLSKLNSLYISGNNLSSLPESLGNLSNLNSLYVSGNNLSSLPKSLYNLSNLKLLYVNHTNISSFPELLGNLSSLKSLNISNNNLTSLPNSLGDLANLESLKINEKKITSIPKSLCNLSNLQLLDIRCTNIQQLPEKLNCLKKLKRLDISGLNLRYLPPEILDLNLPFNFSVKPLNNNYINLYNTTLSTQPISIFKQPKELIRIYFENKKIQTHEAKIIFLGDGGVGKTHTISRIRNNCKSIKYETKVTPGVEITSFTTKNNDLKLDFWDFGGQDIMPSIHRCFLTQRALYVIIVSTRTGHLTAQARHWLKTIDAFVPNASVIIAVNCWDNTISHGVNNELLHEEFPNLLQTVIYSATCPSQHEFYQNLLLPVEKYAREMDSYIMELPESWIQIQRTLQLQKAPYIAGSDYFQICHESGLEDNQIAQWLLDWFNDMGICFSYSDVNGWPYHVLRPEWLTNAVYRILLDEKEPNSDGIVKRSYIERDLSYSGIGTEPEIIYSKSDCNIILAIMEKFYLLYFINEQKLFIPALCSEKKPSFSIPENCQQRLEYELQYSYLPDCVIHQLMIWYMENQIIPKYIWRSGLCIQERTRWATITSDYYHSKLRIQLYMQDNSSAQNCHDMLKDIYQAIQGINTRLALQAIDYIIMRKGNQTAHFPLGPLLEAKKQGFKELTSLEDGEFQVYNIDQILDSAFKSDQVRAVLEHTLSNTIFNINAPTIYTEITNQKGLSGNDLSIVISSILKEQQCFTREETLKIASLLSQQNDILLHELGKKMSESKRPLQKLKSFIRDLAQTCEDVETLRKLVTIICNIVPNLTKFLSNK